MINSAPLIKCLAVVVCTAAYCSASLADIYSYTDDNGVMHISNVKPKNQSDRVNVVSRGCESAPGGCASTRGSNSTAVIITPKASAYINYGPRLPAISRGWDGKKGWQDGLNSEAYSELVQQAATEYQVDQALIRAIIHTESAFNPLAKSNKGAEGLMQLIPATQIRFGVIDAQDPEQNIMGGVRYLQYLLQLFDNDTVLASAAYNAGENAVLRYGGVPPYNETENYVARVDSLYKRYAGLTN